MLNLASSWQGEVPQSGFELDLTVQIVNYRTGIYLPSCIDSVLADLEDEGLRYAIKVLDNGSDDDLSTIASAYEHRPVYFHSSNENRGFGGGHNFLAQLHPFETKLILILNPDTVFLQPRTIRRLITRLITTPTAAAVGPLLIGTDGKPQDTDHGELRGWRAAVLNAIGHSYWRPSSNIMEVAWVSGAVLLIPREMLTLLGGFDEHFFLYKEEEDLCLRLRGLGKSVVYDPTIAVMHHGSVVASKGEHMALSLEYFQQKHVMPFATRRILLRAFNIQKKLRSQRNRPTGAGRKGR